MIRKGNDRDIACIGKIYEDILMQQESGHISTGWIRGVYPTSETAREALEAGDLFVMEEEGHIVAAARINQEQLPAYQNAGWKDKNVPDAQVMVLHTLVVDPAFSGRGYGTQFVKFYESYAREKGCSCLRMDTNARNRAARSLYAGLGYREADIVPCVFNGIPDVQLVCLEKELVTVSEKIRERLFEMQDLKYRDFHAKLMPTVSKDTVIGVRIPELRKYARKLAKAPEIGAFLTDLPHEYYDENNLHGYIVEQIRDYDTCLQETERFLPYIDNWATCDTMAPKVFAKHTQELLEAVRRWLASEKPYTVRFGIGMLMRFYLDENFEPEYLEMVSRIRSEEYYVNMMIAWYFATALAKQYDTALGYLEEQRLDVWTHNKAIQKACESCRITAQQKDYLRSLKIKHPEKL